MRGCAGSLGAAAEPRGAAGVEDLLLAQGTLHGARCTRAARLPATQRRAVARRRYDDGALCTPQRGTSMTCTTAESSSGT
mmetsp:Transcript_89312/g.251405  ORF Transcript_89312/g.251405 Transcript_89312/m.251405 type:complete len:80 (+) Transcript_89312:1170-1409(+)